MRVVAALTAPFLAPLTTALKERFLIQQRKGWTCFEHPVVGVAIGGFEVTNHGGYQVRQQVSTYTGVAVR